MPTLEDTSTIHSEQAAESLAAEAVTGPVIKTPEVNDIPWNDSDYKDAWKPSSCPFPTKGGQSGRCGVQPLVRVKYATGEVTVCGHHYQRNLDVLHAKALEVHDFRPLLNTKPSISANA